MKSSRSFFLMHFPVIPIGWSLDPWGCWTAVVDKCASWRGLTDGAQTVGRISNVCLESLPPILHSLHLGQCRVPLRVTGGGGVCRTPWCGWESSFLLLELLERSRGSSVTEPQHSTTSYTRVFLWGEGRSFHQIPKGVSVPQKVSENH